MWLKGNNDLQWKVRHNIFVVCQSSSQAALQDLTGFKPGKHGSQVCCQALLSAGDTEMLCGCVDVIL